MHSIFIMVVWSLCRWSVRGTYGRLSRSTRPAVRSMTRPKRQPAELRRRVEDRSSCSPPCVHQKHTDVHKATKRELEHIPLFQILLVFALHLPLCPHSLCLLPQMKAEKGFPWLLVCLQCHCRMCQGHLHWMSYRC